MTTQDIHENSISPTAPDLAGTPFADTDELRRAVTERYARTAVAVRQASSVGSGCCGGPAASATCGPSTTADADGLIGRVLYDDGQASELPEAALAASLGCGNPTALATLSPGETVLDLGSGGGIDVLLSARRVGPAGKAYGLDMTPEMLELARENQRRAGVDNVEFLQGTIEDIPLPDASVDVIISNCVINLSGDKDRVFREAFRVLRPGGRFAVSDIVLLRDLPEVVPPLVAAWTGCVAGALVDQDYVDRLAAAGFEDVTVETTQVFSADDLAAMAGELAEQLPAGVDRAALLADVDGAGASAFIRARRPA
jgi:SAM-dependent methyltransferase